MTYDDRANVTPTPKVMVLKWSGIATGFNDQSPATTWASLTSSYPYRCVWTNELR